MKGRVSLTTVFQFRVFDGNDFSEAVYTMYINVVETIVAA
jgi:hypothetical protein